MNARAVKALPVLVFLAACWEGQSPSGVVDAATVDEGSPDAAPRDASPPDLALDAVPRDGLAPDGLPQDGALPDGSPADGAAPDGAELDGALPDGPLPDGLPADGPLPDGPLPDLAPDVPPDDCPDDPDKVEPGACGCGVPDTPNCDEVDPPVPSPLVWAEPPHATGSTRVAMSAARAAAPRDVEYYFECVAGDCHDSGWQAERTWEDEGLAPDQPYSWRVRARDGSLNENATEWSAAAEARTEPDPGYRAGVDLWLYDFAEPVPAAPDVSEAEPDVRRHASSVDYAAGPGPWAELPDDFADTFASRHGGFLRVDAPGDYTLLVLAEGGARLWLGGELAAQAEGGAEASATRAFAPGYHPFRLDAWVDAGGVGLTLAWVPPGGERGPVPASALYRADPPDVSPPAPLGWVVAPSPLGPDRVVMRAAEAADPSGVQYYFECLDGPCRDSGWQADPGYTDEALPAGTYVTYGVRARDMSVAGSATELLAAGPIATNTFIPELAGLTEGEVLEVLEAAALRLGDVSRAFDDEVPQGQVRAQDPAPGIEAPAGLSVDVVVSLGPAIPVPDLEGGPEAAVAEQLEALGLVLGAVRRVSRCDVPVGQVISQLPAPGALGWGGATVDLVVSAGPDAAVINELMYHPASDGPLEFVELHNRCVSPLSLQGWVLTGVGDFTFPEGAALDAGGFLVVAEDAAAFEATYGFVPFGEYDGGLSNDGEALRLVREDGTIADQLIWSDLAPWPVTPDGLGPSLELIDPALDHASPRSWAASVAPAQHTAGQPNSVRADGLPPWIEGVVHGVLEVGVPIVVTATVLDADVATLTYVVDWGEPVEVEMVADGDAWSAEIPGQPLGTMVRYRIGASGPTGLARSPRVDDSVSWHGTYLAPSVDSDLPVIHWIVHPDAWAAALAHFRTDEVEPAFVFHRGILYTEVTFRVRGHSSRGFPKKHWKFKFPQGHEFADETLTPRPVDGFNLQSSWGDKSFVREILSYETFRDAGAPSHLAAPVFVYQNGELMGLYIWVEEKSRQNLRRNGLDPEATYYKAFRQAEAASLAAVAAGYEKSNPDDGDYAALHALLDGVNNLQGQARRDFLFDHFDIPAMLTYQAASVLVHNNDQVAKNYYIFHDIFGTGRWSYHVWDVDLTFGRSYEGRVLNDRIFAADDEVGRENVSPSHPLFGDRTHQKWDFLWNRITDALLAEPEIREMYYRRLRTLMDELLVEGRYEARIDELAALIADEAAADKAKWGQYGVPETLETAVARLKQEYLAVRREHLFFTHRVAEEIPDAQSAAPRVVLSEIMYNPADVEEDPTDDSSDREFIELYNPSDESVDLSGWEIEAVGLTFPPGAVLLAGRYGVVVKRDPAFREAYGSGHYVLADYGGKLAGAGERVALTDRAGEVVDEVTYDDVAPWPVEAAGAGPSLELIDVDSDHTLPESWAASLVPGGTPGAPNSVAGAVGGPPAEE